MIAREFLKPGVLIKAVYGSDEWYIDKILSIEGDFLKIEQIKSNNGG